MIDTYHFLQKWRKIGCDMVAAPEFPAVVAISSFFSLFLRLCTGTDENMNALLLCMVDWYVTKSK